MNKENIPPWRNTLVDSSISDNKTLSIIVESLFDDLEKNGIEHINNGLLLIDMKEAKPSHLVAILSSLYSLRSNMSNWIIFRELMIEEFKTLNLKGIDSALKGLMN